MPNPSSVCGEFVEPTFVDYGRCHPRRLKRDCRNHVPVVPGWPDQVTSPPDGCVDENILVVFENGVLKTIAAIFDENCELILDENDQPILGVTV